MIYKPKNKLGKLKETLEITMGYNKRWATNNFISQRTKKIKYFYYSPITLSKYMIVNSKENI